MVDRETKEHKLLALMVNDLGLDLEKPEMVELEEEVGALVDEELDRTLAGRLDLPYPADEGAMEQALAQVDEPERPPEGETDANAEAPDTGHEPRPEERKA